MQEMTKSLYQWMVSHPKYKNSAINKLKLNFRMKMKGFIATLISNENLVSPVECDVLIIHPSYKNYNQERRKKFVGELKKSGLKVKEFVSKSDKDKLKRREFCKVNGIPSFFRWDAYHAKYILSRYKAKVILTSRNGWVVPSFIKRVRDEGSIVIHIAHAVLTGRSRKYSYYDYDYYFVYGQSSYDYLKGLSYSFGEANICFEGPSFFYSNRKYRLPVSGNNITFLCSAPEYENTMDYIEISSWLEMLVRFNVINKLYVKCHPRGSNKRWAELSEQSRGRIEVIGNDELFDSFDSSKYAVMSYTNAIVDAAYYGIPVIMLGNSLDYFQLERFSVPRARDYKTLVKYINLEAPKPQLEFAHYHIEKRFNVSTSLINSITNIVNSTADVKC